MSINIYPAHLKGREVIWADQDCHMNLANGNFFQLADHLGIPSMKTGIGMVKVKAMRLALQTTDHTRYHDRLNQLCAQAEILKAPYIAFA